MMKIVTNLEKAGKPFWIFMGSILLCGVAILDYATGAKLSFSLFYLIPIIVLGWGLKGDAGIEAAFISTAIWLLVEILSGADYSNIFISIWNAITRLGFFLFPALLLRNLEREREHARTDFLTGAFNIRVFNELAERERDLSVRYEHPFTIAFIDLDNFKTINDMFGHKFGDAVLRTIANGIKQNLRKTDIVARVGGDEFAILLPETGPEPAKTAISNMQSKLMEEMLKNKWPVTFSTGVVTLTDQKPSVDEILGIADRMMYMVKNNGKNDIKYATR